jgi:phenylalanyl-tRNA synthetase beta chain
MKISLTWLKDYLKTDLTPSEISILLTDIGLEVENVEETFTIPGGLEGLVIGYVKNCIKHPNADRLSLTEVDLGLENTLSIVCGASNIGVGQKVIVAKAGTTIFPTEGDPKKIEKGTIRGQLSEGMICSEDEIGLGTSHDGIVVLPEDAPIGSLAADYLNIKKDIIFEIGLTPNRSDATNHIGVAKDLFAAIQINYNNLNQLNLPDISNFKASNNHYPIQIDVVNPEACPRYAGLTISDVKITESPSWLKEKLKSIGVRPINNIVDITNFVLHESGQPLHAFDLSKIAENKIIVKTLSEGTEFVALDETTRKLSKEDLMICDGNEVPLCMAGVFGGASSGVSEQTTSIFLESAHFNPSYIRKSSMRHQLRTDAAKVFEKGSDPNQVVVSLKRAAMLICELADGHISSDIMDIYPKPVEPKKININLNNVKKLIGIEIPIPKLESILTALGINIIEKINQDWSVQIPTNKADVTREADVIEEILRIYGFNQIPIGNSMHISVENRKENKEVIKREEISNLFIGFGFSEIMGLSLAESKKYAPTFYDERNLVFIQNTSNVHLNIMRPDLLGSMIDAIVHNQNRQNNDLKLFEFGKSYQVENGQIIEKSHFSLAVTGKIWQESWLTPTVQNETGFYYIKSIVQHILSKCGITEYELIEIEKPEFEYGIQLKINESVLAHIGKIGSSYGLKNPAYFADLNWTEIVEQWSIKKTTYVPISKYPGTRRDLALVVDNSVKFIDIALLAEKQGKKLLKSLNLFDVYIQKDQLGEHKKSYAVSFYFEDAEKTLVDKDIEEIMNLLIKEYETKLNAKIRR